MLKRTSLMLVIAIVHVAAGAWAFGGAHGGGGAPAGPQISKFRQKNVENIDRLRVGMDEKEVSKVMEDRVNVQTYNLKAKAEVLSNPVRIETPSGKDGAKLTVRYYYAYQNKADSKITTDELCPVVLREGVLEGWGWAYYEKEIGPLPPRP